MRRRETAAAAVYRSMSISAKGGSAPVPKVKRTGLAVHFDADTDDSKQPPPVAPDATYPYSRSYSTPTPLTKPIASRIHTPTLNRQKNLSSRPSTTPHSHPVHHPVHHPFHFQRSPPLPHHRRPPNLNLRLCRLVNPTTRWASSPAACASSSTSGLSS